ncbi:MAG: hypothetical protein FWC73_03530 [Defluviitaleaceae bacterium]|nr:hypothetical protein [Defluviitaleaceae bacterium]
MLKLIDITDLYHPHQDVGDNFDLIMPYALPDIDLLLVILDCTEKFREPYADHSEWPDSFGPREPGIIPVTQLNYIFNRNVPFGISPLNPMVSPDDKMSDIPGYQNQGVDMLLKTLDESDEPVDIAVYGSLRCLAVAYNRNPQLLLEKVRMVHISASSSTPDYLEWNVLLDPNAFVCVLRSELPLTLYPCKTGSGAFAPSEFCTYWSLNDLGFIRKMDMRLQQYLCYAFNKSLRHDFLRVMDEEPDIKELDKFSGRQHNVWETAIWIEMTNRMLIEGADGCFRIVPKDEVTQTDKIFKTDILPCKLKVYDTGIYEFALCSEEKTNKFIYRISDPIGQEKALNEALGALYTSFKP